MRQWDKCLSSLGLGFLIFKKRTFNKRFLPELLRFGAESSLGCCGNLDSVTQPSKLWGASGSRFSCLDSILVEIKELNFKKSESST